MASRLRLRNMGKGQGKGGGTSCFNGECGGCYRCAGLRCDEYGKSCECPECKPEDYEELPTEFEESTGSGILTVRHRPRVCNGCELCIGAYCGRYKPTRRGIRCECPKCKPEKYGWEVVVLAERDDCRELAARWDAMNWRDYKMDDFEKKFQYKRAGPSEEKDEESDEESENTPGYLQRGCGPFFFGPLSVRSGTRPGSPRRQWHAKAARKSAPVRQPILVADEEGAAGGRFRLSSSMPAGGSSSQKNNPPRKALATKAARKGAPVRQPILVADEEERSRGNEWGRRWCNKHEWATLIKMNGRSWYIKGIEDAGDPTDGDWLFEKCMDEFEKRSPTKLTLQQREEARKVFKLEHDDDDDDDRDDNDYRDPWCSAMTTILGRLVTKKELQTLLGETDSWGVPGGLDMSGTRPNTPPPCVLALRM